ncbi:IS1595 family ISPna2 group transposase [Oleiphilus messinensis]|uniref:IS1595 family ISPna2 group transposase n=1 Tax=Oleiphilus messinensis TaxID=141451 RepID=A0A1Y0IC12_9GAMM|nr:IS1595 family ISPna2 group transposase [Oleiphilus messinensis]
MKPPDAHVESIIECSTQNQFCRHCGCNDIKKWGSANGLQRYKCKHEDCGKTFNGLTGTPLARLHNRHKWLDHLLCMLDSLPLRKVAKRIEVDLTTAFRWRHRFLKMATKTQVPTLNGVVEADETFFSESYKGKRTIHHRAPRRRGGQGNRKHKDDKISVLIVRDRRGRVHDFVFGELRKEQIHSSLKPIVESDSVFCTDGASWYKTFAEKEKIAHHRLIALDKNRIIGKEFHIQNVNNYISRLKTWMKRFNGVGTDYLENYLGWMRLFETRKRSQIEWLKLAILYK